MTSVASSSETHDSNESSATDEKIVGRTDRRVKTVVTETTVTTKKRLPKQTSQKTVDKFWHAFAAKYPGIVLNILPEDTYARAKTRSRPKGTVQGTRATSSFDDAKAECIAAVHQISKECRRVNMRYRDVHFDIDNDLKQCKYLCLNSIKERGTSGLPSSVKRVPDIFKEPQFFVDGAATADVRQGAIGDCWFLAAVGALGDKNGLIDKICVERDEQVGVYGFVFHRDGEWIHTVIDDKLYLSRPDYDEDRWAKLDWALVGDRKNAEKEYIEAFQTGSKALFFAQCNDENETWLPLLEKAYAKAHGDYRSIDGGFTGEAIEDLTGGVTTELFTTDILDKDIFWEREMKHVGEQFLFGCATGRYDQGSGPEHRQGIIPMHAYTVLRATEYKGERLVLVRNPWGKTEWNGRWSDGSEQWTPESMAALKHRFGNDGIFWIAYDDLLTKYQYFDRTRLFDDSWKMCHQWTSIDVRWTADYNDTKFSLTLTEPGPAVIVLSQLDDRYWKGLEGKYSFSLHFRLEKDDEDGHIVRSHGNYWMRRSVSVEVDLEPGTYSVFLKIKAKRYPHRTSVERVVRDNCTSNPEKLIQVGLSYDLAHAKGIVAETEAKRMKEENELNNKAKAIKAARKEKYTKWLKAKRQMDRDKRQKARWERHQAAKKTSDQSDTFSDNVHVDEKEISEAKQESSSNIDHSQTPPSETEKQEDAKITDNEAIDTPPSQEDPSHTKSKPDDEGENACEDGSRDKPSDGHVTAGSIDQGANEQATVQKKTTTIQTTTEHANSERTPKIEVDQDDDDTASCMSFASSIDSVLDLELPSTPDSSLSDADEPDNEPFAADPWNAVCVVGLRVYTQTGNVSVKVVRPKIGDDEETKLDVDDASRALENLTIR